MDAKIDFSTYSFQELLEAKSTIDKQEYPERAQEIEELIAKHQQKQTKDQQAEEKLIVREGHAKFHGDAKEYFSIWIVNLLLTIVTLGIYSAWAKVRNNRYMYSNTEIDGHRFSYLADPIQILKGRVIAIGLFAIYYFTASSSPFAVAIMFVALFFATPFLVCQSLKFRMKVTAYRNVRFSFKGQYGRALLVFCIYPALSVFTLYLAFPWVLKKMDEFVIDNTQFGDKSFCSLLSGGSYFAAGLLSVLIAIPFTFVPLFLLGAFEPETAKTAEAGTSYLVTLGTMFSYLLVYTIASSFYQASIRNHIFGSTKLVDVAKFESSLDFVNLAWINLSNLLALILTLGFAMPWTQIRKMNYLCDNTKVSILEGADSVMSSPDGDSNAIGDEVSDAFDLDIALG